MIRSCDTLMLLYLFRSDIIQEQIDHPFGCHERADLVGTELRILQSSKRRNSCGTNKICDIAEQ